VDVLRTIEKQSGFLRLIYYLGEHGETPLTEIMDETEIPVHQLYSSIKKGKELGLVSTKVDSKKYPPRNLVSLTQKGKRLSKEISRIIEIME
jgi:DNA-binding PadR family transcriptional regulator